MRLPYLILETAQRLGINEENSKLGILVNNRIHVFGYEDFYISHLKHCDVLLGVTWFQKEGATVNMVSQES